MIHPLYSADSRGNILYDLFSWDLQFGSRSLETIQCELFVYHGKYLRGKISNIAHPQKYNKKRIRQKILNYIWISPLDRLPIVILLFLAFWMSAKWNSVTEMPILPTDTVTLPHQFIKSQNRFSGYSENNVEITVNLTK